MHQKMEVGKLLHLFPNAECCDCGKEPEEDDEVEWIVYKKTIIYCPKCAKEENLD